MIQKKYLDPTDNKELFKRKSSIINPNRKFEEFTIFTNGIRGYVHKTNKKGILITEGYIDLITNNNFIKINEYKYFFLFKPKIPNGFRLITKDNKIIFIYTGFMGREYHLVKKALKKCLDEKWDNIFDNKTLIKEDVFNIHK